MGFGTDESVLLIEVSLIVLIGWLNVCLFVCCCLQERTKNAQFIIISLRNNMFELADRLVGIYKTDNCTKSVTINPNKLKIGRAPSETQSMAEATTSVES